MPSVLIQTPNGAFDIFVLEEECPPFILLVVVHPVVTIVKWPPAESMPYNLSHSHTHTVDT